MSKAINSQANLNYNEEAIFSVGLLINKLDRDSLKDLTRSLKRFIVRKCKAKALDIKEVNTFLFVNASFPPNLISDTESRIKIENGVKDIIIDYALKENNKFSKQIAKNIEIKDITQILLDLINNSNSLKKKQLIETVTRRGKEIQQRSIVHVTNVILNSYILSWDKEDYRIIFPDERVERKEKSADAFGTFQSLLENLSVIQYAYVSMENLSWIIGSYEYALDNLYELISNLSKEIKSSPTISKSFWRSLRVIFGLLSTTQQILSDLLKQLNKFVEIKEEFKKQCKQLDFYSLTDVLKRYNIENETADFIVWISQLLQNTKMAYSLLLDLINCCKTSDRMEMENIELIISNFGWVLSDIQTMKFFAEKFRDITFFQSFPPEIVVETKKEMRLPEDVVIKGVSLFKTYRLFGSTVYALRGIDIEVCKGEMVAILGPSGSGKTTLLNLLAGLDSPDNGAIFFKGKNIHLLPDSVFSMYRRKDMGFIFQYYNLIPQLTVLENVMLPGLMVGRPAKEVRQKAIELLEIVGIERFKNQFPIKLSGGQMQRVTIARSMINDPVLLFADEPTGDLDNATGKIVVDLIHRFSKEKGTAVIFVTHDEEMARKCDRIIRIRDGRIHSEEIIKKN